MALSQFTIGTATTLPETIPPATPVFLSPVIGTNDVVLVWNAVYGAKYYTLQWRILDGEWENEWTGTSLKTTVKGLESDTKYEFRLKASNDYGDSEWVTIILMTNPETESTGFIMGIYHELNNPIRMFMDDTTRVRNSKNTTGKIPMILCLYDDVIKSGLEIGDYTILNDKKFKVNGVVNVQEWNIIADISLEAIDDGNNVSV